MTGKMLAIFSILLSVGFGCAQRRSQAAPTLPRGKYDVFEKPSVDGIRSLTPEECKAILVSRTVFEVEFGTIRDGKTERRFSPHRIEHGWRVQVLTLYHRTANGRDEEGIEPSMPAVFLDQDYRFIGFSPGA